MCGRARSFGDWVGRIEPKELSTEARGLAYSIPTTGLSFEGKTLAPAAAAEGMQ
jgi:hypothetical protein